MKNLFSRSQKGKKSRSKSSSTGRNREDTAILKVRIQEKLARSSNKNA